MSAVLFALLAALGFGCQAIFARLGLQYVRPTAGTLISITASFLFVGTLALIFNAREILAISLIAIPWFILTALLHFPMGRLLNYTGTQLAGATRAVPIVGTSPLFSAIFAIAFLGERLTPLLLLGTLAIVIGAALIVSEAYHGTANRGSKNR